MPKPPAAESLNGYRNFLVMDLEWNIVATDSSALKERVGENLWHVLDPYWEEKAKKYFEYGRDNGACSILAYHPVTDRIQYERIYRDGNFVRVEAEIWEPERLFMLNESLGTVLEALTAKASGQPHQVEGVRPKKTDDATPDGTHDDGGSPRNQGRGVGHLWLVEE